MPAAGTTLVLQQLSSTRQCVRGSRLQERSSALGGKHRYSSALLRSAVKLGTPNRGSHKNPDKALACKTTNPRARLPQCLSFRPEQFRHIKLIKICLERKGLSVFSITQQSRRERYSARPYCNLHRDWSASADGVWCVCYPTLHNPGCGERKCWGFRSTAGPVGSSDKWCAVTALDHCFRAQIAYLSHQKCACFSHKNVLGTHCVI